MGPVSKIGVLTVTLLILNTCHAEIKMIQATIRHGDRYPEDKQSLRLSYPKDPYLNHTWTTNGKMELTEKGKFNAFKMGLFLRNRYGKLLGLTYDEDEVYFRATDINRTINTGRWIATGLYSSLIQNWNSMKNPMNIPIFLVPIEKDTLNLAMCLCENYYVDRQESENKIKEQEEFKKLKTIFEFLSIHTGIEHSGSLQGFALYHNLYAQSNLGLEMEPWVNSVFPNGQLLDISVMEYKLQSYTERMKRLTGGIWIRKFLDHVYNFTKKTDYRKGYFYINHEINIAAILNTLGVYEPHVPSYLSTVIFELHEIVDELYAKVIHKDKDVLTELVIPGCENSLCPLKTFKAVLKNVTLENFEEDCGKQELLENVM